MDLYEGQVEDFEIKNPNRPDRTQDLEREIEFLTTQISQLSRETHESLQMHSTPKQAVNHGHRSSDSGLPNSSNRPTFTESAFKTPQSREGQGAKPKVRFDDTLQNTCPDRQPRLYRIHALIDSQG